MEAQMEEQIIKSNSIFNLFVPNKSKSVKSAQSADKLLGSSRAPSLSRRLALDFPSFVWYD